MKAGDYASERWLAVALAFAGGYGDPASFVLANTFAGHVTGAFVLAASSVASHDLADFLATFHWDCFFLAGILLSEILRRFAARKPPSFLLSSVMGIEIVLISAAYLAITSQSASRLETFVSCMSLAYICGRWALGLQNGTWQRAGGISVHTTYITGMVTGLLTSAHEKGNTSAAFDQESKANLRVSLHRDI